MAETLIFSTLSGKAVYSDSAVATWHIADLDEAIDALGDEAADYDRDGLRAVAHLGGKSSMKKFVQSKGYYNPADELGTSLPSYYDKFSNRGDV